MSILILSSEINTNTDLVKGNWFRSIPVKQTFCECTVRFWSQFLHHRSPSVESVPKNNLTCVNSYRWFFPPSLILFRQRQSGHSLSFFYVLQHPFFSASVYLVYVYYVITTKIVVLLVTYRSTPRNSGDRPMRSKCKQQTYLSMRER